MGSRIWKDHPITGVGLENYRIYAPRYAGGPGELTFVNFIAERPHVVHNVYLQMMVEVGLVGLGLFLTIIVSSLAAAMRAARRFERQGGLRGRGAEPRRVRGGCWRRLDRLVLHLERIGFQIWVLLAFGPMLLWRNARRTRSRPEPAPAPRCRSAPPRAHSPGAGLAGLKRRPHAARAARACRSDGGPCRRARAPSVRPKITATASPPSV